MNVLIGAAVWATLAAAVLALFIWAKRHRNRVDSDPCDCTLLCEGECWNDGETYEPAGGWP